MDGFKKRVDTLESNWADELEMFYGPFESRRRSRRVRHLSASFMAYKR